MSNNLLNNTTSLQNILEALQNKATPSNGVDTSDATAVAEDIMLDKTAYVKGEKITGAFTLEEELNTQDDLITQLQNVVNSLPDAGGASNITKKTLLTINILNLTGITLTIMYTVDHVFNEFEISSSSNNYEIDRGAMFIINDRHQYNILDCQGVEAYREANMFIFIPNGENATIILEG